MVQNRERAEEGVGGGGKGVSTYSELSRGLMSGIEKIEGGEK